MMSGKMMGKLVVCRTQLGATHCLGVVTAYCDAPVYELEVASGEKRMFRADLVVEASPEQVVDYWMNRALTAERAK